jgi:hypothetical protein
MSPISSWWRQCSLPTPPVPIAANRPIASMDPLGAPWPTYHGPRRPSNCHEWCVGSVVGLVRARARPLPNDSRAWRRYARTTTQVATTQAYTGLSLGSAAGARHLSRHGLPVSRHTVLRRVRNLSVPEGPAPAIIGRDDWAWRKGHRDGTIVVDLEGVSKVLICYAL